MKEWEFPSGEPATEWYRGPVRWVNPTYGEGYAEMFCPRCGSTALKSLDRNGKKLRCSDCGRTFRLDFYPDDRGREYSINHCGTAEYEHLPADDVNYYASGTVVDHEDAGRLHELASSYYGESYDALYDDEYDVIDDAEIRNGLNYDVPFVEINHLTSNGYLGGMEVGDELCVPGTDVSIIRTKNAKSRRGGRPARRMFRR